MRCVRRHAQQHRNDFSSFKLLMLGMRVLPSLLLLPSVNALLILSRSTRQFWCNGMSRHLMPPSTASFFTITNTALKDSLSSEEEQQNDTIKKKKKTQKKGFVINPNLPSVISSKDGVIDAPKENVEQRSTGRLGVVSDEDRKNPPQRRGRQQQGRGRNNSSRRSVPAPPKPGQPGRGCYRNLIHIGAEVLVVLKADQRNGIETRGNVGRHLTNSPHHARGIKVMLTSGQVGRVTKIIDDDETAAES